MDYEVIRTGFRIDINQEQLELGVQLLYVVFYARGKKVYAGAYTERERVKSEIPA